MLQREQSAIPSTVIKLRVVIKTFVLSIFEWPLYTGFTVSFLFSQAKEPKDVISLDEINAAFVPEKLGNPNGLQITYMKNGVTRNIFVYCDNSQVRVFCIFLLLYVR